MKYDMIVSDFDGTLGEGPDGKIHPETVKAIQGYVARGGKFVICSGRMLSSIRGIALKLNLKGPVIAYQGAMINDIESGSPILDEGVSKHDTLEIIKRFKAEGLEVVLEANDILYYEHDSEYTDFYRLSGTGKTQKVDNLEKFTHDNLEHVSKACGTSPDADKIAEIAQRYNKEYGEKLMFNSGMNNLIECINPKYSKGFAVRFVANYYKIPLERVMTVGDSTNDIALVDGEWHGVAVGDAREDLKKCAKEITVPFKEQPIKVLIEKYGMD